MVANFSPVHRSSKELRSSKTLSEDVTTNDEENDSDITAEVRVEPEAGKYYAKFPLAPMGVLAPRLRTLDGPLVPPSTRAEIFRRTCLINFLAKSGNSKHFSFFSKKIKIWGGG